MLFQTVERLTQIELQQLRREAYRHALLRRAPRANGRRFARWLRALADRLEGCAAAVTGPWSQDFNIAEPRTKLAAPFRATVGDRHA